VLFYHAAVLIYWKIAAPKVVKLPETKPAGKKMHRALSLFHQSTRF
jgi:hypothetical protein